MDISVFERSNFAVLGHRNPDNGTLGSLPVSEFDGDDVYWLIGQSNMIGRPSIRVGIDDDYSLIAGKVFQYGYNSETISAATNPLDHVNETAGDMGLWLEFVKALIPSLPVNRRILLAPAAQGGTSLASNWSPGQPLNTSAKVRVNAAMVPAMGETNFLKGALWLQGETDADLGEANANLYLGRVQAMYDNFVLTVTGMTSSTPFIVGTIKPDKPNATIINSALQTFANNNAAVKFVDLTDLSWFDSDHYDAPSLATAGQRYAGAL